MAPFLQHPENSYRDESIYSEIAVFTFAMVLAVIMVTATYCVIGTQRASVLHADEFLVDNDDDHVDEDDSLEISISRERSYDTFIDKTCRAESASSSSSSSTKVSAPTLTVPNMPPPVCSTVKQTLLTCSCIDPQIPDLINRVDLDRAIEDHENTMQEAAEVVKTMKLEPVADPKHFDDSGWLATLLEETMEARAFYRETYRLVHDAMLVPKLGEGESAQEDKPTVYIAVALWLQTADVNEAKELIEEAKLRQYLSQFPI